MNEKLSARRLKSCRVAARETLEQIGRLVGVNRSTVYRWENGDTARINLPTMYRLAAHFGVSPAWLRGEENGPDTGNAASSAAAGDWLEQNAVRLGELASIPILGAVRGGIGGEVVEELIGEETVQKDRLHRDETLFWLKVAGDSMAPAINEDDLVLVRKQDSVDSGQYAVVIVGGEEGLVKKVLYGGDWIELHSVNPYYPPRRFDGANVLEVRVVGLVLESKRKFV
ncbi:MAG: XRE family transcriptional regulator [Oscillospiraceae bacterium]|nr:XRE family transcriptional regulator [Oscillospiraceae bacterium]